MKIAEAVHDDLRKRIEEMSLEECRRMADNMPLSDGPIDSIIMTLLRDRIAQLRQEGAKECD